MSIKKGEGRFLALISYIFLKSYVCPHRFDLESFRSVAGDLRVRGAASPQGAAAWRRLRPGGRRHLSRGLLSGSLGTVGFMTAAGLTPTK